MSTLTFNNNILLKTDFLCQLNIMISHNKVDLLNNIFSDELTIFHKGKAMMRAYHEHTYIGLIMLKYNKDTAYNPVINRPLYCSIFIRTGDIYVYGSMYTTGSDDFGDEEQIMGPLCKDYNNVHILDTLQQWSILSIDGILYIRTDAYSLYNVDKDVLCIGVLGENIVYSKPQGTFAWGLSLPLTESLQHTFKVSDLVFDQLIGNQKCILGIKDSQVYIHRLQPKYTVTKFEFTPLDIRPRQISVNYSEIYYQQDGNIYTLSGKLVYKDAVIITNRYTFTLVSSRFYAKMLCLVAKAVNLRIPKMVLILIMKTIDSNLRYQNGKFSSVLLC